jgi:hypothetical protein
MISNISVSAVEVVWIGVLAAVTVLWTAWIAIYRIFFHPLASVPGPSLAAITRLYAFYFNINKRGTFYLEIERLHKIYGSFCEFPTYSPHHLVF